MLKAIKTRRSTDIEDWGWAKTQGRGWGGLLAAADSDQLPVIPGWHPALLLQHRRKYSQTTQHSLGLSHFEASWDRTSWGISVHVSPPRPHPLLTAVFGKSQTMRSGEGKFKLAQPNKTHWALRCVYSRLYQRIVSIVVQVSWHWHWLMWLTCTTQRKSCDL